MIPRSLQLLEQLLAGHHLTAGELDDLVTNRVAEDQYIEYKQGKELLKPEANDTIREYISGFANSSGGILIIGIDAPNDIPVQVTGCHGHNKGKLDDWAARCLTQVSPYFSPLPSFHIVSHPSGEVLIGVVSRSLSLVPLIKAGKQIYYFRLHDQTLPGPDYLVADLYHGRRQQPTLGVTAWRLLNVDAIHENEIAAMDIQFNLRFEFENSGLVWAEDSRWGVIAWTHRKSIASVLKMSPPSSNLLSFVEARDIDSSNYSRQRDLLHFRAATRIDEPFDVASIDAGFTIPMRAHNSWFSYNWKAALYVTARNSLPIWYQIDFAISRQVAQASGNKDQLAILGNSISITRLIGERPIVAWDKFRIEA